MRAYFVEAERTSAMLARCTAEPLPLTERFGLLSQEITENEALREIRICQEPSPRGGSTRLPVFRLNNRPVPWGNRKPQGTKALIDQRLTE